MASTYPNTVDAFDDISGSDPMNSAGNKLHSAQHTNAGDAIVNIQTELGLNPSDGPGVTFATVKARLNDMESRLGNNPVFAQTTAPASPVDGWIWLDTTNLA